MGIYLPNIEKMPRKGEMLVVFPDGTSYVCFNGMRERLAQTTAFPVPPHGRLIDADAMKIEVFAHDKLMKDGWNNMDMGMFTGNLMEVIDSAPTIIPAEEGEI